ncbi:unnamed protein product [Parajaminaea phylloscopi]
MPTLEPRTRSFTTSVPGLGTAHDGLVDKPQAKSNMAASSSSLSLFWELASPSEDKRIQSSSNLVSSLVAQQSAIVATTSRETLDGDDGDANEAALAALEEHLDKSLAADVSYSLRRLVRGLASPREQSRIGFAVALTELLSKLQAVLHPKDVLALIKKHSTAAGKVSRSEERNLLFARLFGIQALLRSGLLLGHPHARVAEVKETVQLLVELGQAKAWLSESAGWILAELLDESISKCPNKDLREHALQVLVQHATSGELSPEKLALLLKLSPLHDPQHHSALKKGDVLSSANLPMAAKVLRNASTISPDADSEDVKDGSGAHNPKIHFVWDCVLDAYFGKAQASPKTRAPFADFYRTAVDDSLFATQASPERKSWGFQVFAKALPILPAADKPLLFTPNFMRTWINQLSSKDRLLHKAATNAAAAVQETVKESPQAGFALIAQLLGKHGSQSFDRLTNTKTVEGLLAAMDAQGVRDYVEWTVKLIAESSEVAKRRWGLDQLLLLVRNTAVPTDDDCVEEILTYLTAGAFFVWKKAPKRGLLSIQPKPAFDDDLRQLCRSRLLSCLTELAERTTTLANVSSAVTDGKARRVPGVDSKGVPWILKSWNIFRALSVNVKEFSATMTEELQNVSERASSLLKKLENMSRKDADSSKRERLAAFETLVVASALFAHESQEENPDELLEQLQDCHDRLFSQQDVDDEISGSELLLDFLVGLLERPSAFLRAITEQVFATFSADMNVKSIDHLVDQLGLNEEPEGDEEDEDADMEDADKESSETSSDSASSEEGSDDEEDAQVDVELRDKVFAALKAGGMADTEDGEAEGDEDVEDAEGGESGGGEDDDAESLPDFTDEQMLQIDDQLADIFRSRLGSRKNNKEAKQDAIAFRNKILDLLAIYCKKCPSSPLVVRLVRPLFVLATESDEDDKQVSNKAANILRNNICKAKDVPQGADLEVATEDLEAVHGFARRTTSGELAALANVANVFLSRVCFASGSPASDKTVKLYNDTLGDFLTRNASQLKGQFLIDAFRRLPQLGWEVRSKLFEGCSLTAPIKPFRQQQAMQMLQTTVTQLAQSKSPEDEARLLKLLPDVAEAVFASLAAAASAPAKEAAGDNINANKLKELLKVALQAARVTRQVNASGVKTVWKPTKIREAADALGKSERFQQSTSLQGLLRQLLSVVEGGASSKDGSSKGEKKRKEQASGGGDGDRDGAAGDVSAADVSTNGNGVSSKRQKQSKGGAAAAAGKKKERRRSVENKKGE